MLNLAQNSQRHATVLKPVVSSAAITLRPKSRALSHVFQPYQQTDTNVLNGPLLRFTHTENSCLVSDKHWKPVIQKFRLDCVIVKCSALPRRSLS